MVKSVRYCDRCKKEIKKHFSPDCEVTVDKPLIAKEWEDEARTYSAYMCRANRTYELCPDCRKSFKAWMKVSIKN